MADLFIGFKGTTDLTLSVTSVRPDILSSCHEVTALYDNAQI